MTGDIAIRVRGLGKKYTLGGPQEQYHTFRDAIVNSVKAPFKRFHPTPPSEEFWALKDVSFDVYKGEVIGIIGRNGAGKSTLLKILSRITTPTEGMVELHGRVGSLLEVGTGFHPELTGRENIYLSGSILGMKQREIDEKLDEIIKFSEIEKFLDTPVKRYSSGMYVRLAFAVAAHMDTEILLVDEVLAVGDAQFQKKCLGKMGEVAKEGRTVLYVSHNMGSVIHLCSRAILIHNGKIEIDGIPDITVQKYMSKCSLNSGVILWTDPENAPGSDDVRLNSVRILQNDCEKSASGIDITNEIIIEISYLTLKKGLILSPAIWLKDKMNTLVFSSSNHKSLSLIRDEWNKKPHPTGIFRSKCVIPGNFLNEGMYSISVFIVEYPNKVHIFEENVISFEVHDSGEYREEFPQPQGGAIRPKLAWSTELVKYQQGPME